MSGVAAVDHGDEIGSTLHQPLSPNPQLWLRFWVEGFLIAFELDAKFRMRGRLVRWVRRSWSPSQYGGVRLECGGQLLTF